MATELDIAIGSRNEVTKRFNFVVGSDGDVAFDTTEAHAVMTSVAEDFGTNPFDPNHGSELSTLKNITSRTASTAESMTLAALVALEQDSLITGVAATASVDRNAATAAVDLKWTTPGGGPQQRKTVEV